MRDGEVRESFRRLQLREGQGHGKAFSFMEVEDDVEPDGDLNLADMSQGAATPMKDFWIACGHHLLDRDESGGLRVTDEFLKAYFARPELMPPDEACAVERRLHRELLPHPRQPVSADEIAAIVDADARENWRFVLAFRDLLLRHPTLEAAYLAIVRSRSQAICRRCSSISSCT